MKKNNEDEVIHYQWYSGSASWGWEVRSISGRVIPIDRILRNATPITGKVLASGTANSWADASAARHAAYEKIMLENEVENEKSR